MKVIQDVDIFSANQDIIALMANCHGRYEKGFALRVKRSYPDTYYKHYEFCERHMLPERVLGKLYMCTCGSGHRVASLFGQIERINIDTDIVAFRDSLTMLRDNALVAEQYIAIPFHLDMSDEVWELLEPVFDEVMPEGLVTEYTKYLRSF